LSRIYELVRQIWEEERIPEELKAIVIVPIHKRGDRDRWENYRGIKLWGPPPSYSLGTRVLFQKVKQLEQEANYAPQSSAEVNMSGAVPPLHPKCLHDMCRCKV
jgi:hypothetical protein